MAWLSTHGQRLELVNRAQHPTASGVWKIISSSAHRIRINGFCQPIQAPITLSSRGQEMRARIEDNGKKSCGTWDLVSLTGGDDEVETKMLHLILIKQHTMHKTTRSPRRSKRPFGKKTSEVGNPVRAWYLVYDLNNVIVNPLPPRHSPLSLVMHLGSDLHGSDAQRGTINEFPNMMEEVMNLIIKWLENWTGMYQFIWSNLFAESRAQSNMSKRLSYSRN